MDNMITEWGYNLYDACGRYSHDPRIGLFYGILQKEVIEFSLADQISAMQPFLL